MYTAIIIVHVIVCILLVTIVLIQSGRGGGLVETFSSAESLFGTKTNAFLTRATAVLAVLFIITCLTLAFLATKRSASLIKQQALPISFGQEQVPAEPIATTDAATIPAIQ